MAARRSYASDRRQSGGYRSMQYGSRQAYMYGNIVTKPEYEPRRRKSSAKPKKKVCLLSFLVLQMIFFFAVHIPAW